jgi:hypothetical protein
MRTWSVCSAWRWLQPSRAAAAARASPAENHPSPRGGSAPQAAPPRPSHRPGQARRGEDDEPAPLLAWADSAPTKGKAPLAIAFTADVEGGKAPLTYVWKFGDGSPDSNEANPKHTYSKPGTYRADLEVKDSRATPTRTTSRSPSSERGARGVTSRASRRDHGPPPRHGGGTSARARCPPCSGARGS